MRHPRTRTSSAVRSMAVVYPTGATGRGTIGSQTTLIGAWHRRWRKDGNGPALLASAMLLSSWFLALLIGLASSSLFGWVALEVRRFRRRRLGRPVLRRRRALLARAGALLLVVVLSAAAAAAGGNRPF